MEIEDIPERIMALMETFDCTARALAGDFAVTKAGVCEWLKERNGLGRRNMARLEQLEEIAEAMKRAQDNNTWERMAFDCLKSRNWPPGEAARLLLEPKKGEAGKDLDCLLEKC